EIRDASGPIRDADADQLRDRTRYVAGRHNAIRRLCDWRGVDRSCDAHDLAVLRCVDRRADDRHLRAGIFVVASADVRLHPALTAATQVGMSGDGPPRGDRCAPLGGSAALPSASVRAYI